MIRRSVELLIPLLALVGVLPGLAWGLELSPPPGARKIVFLDGRDRPLRALEDEDGDGSFEATFFYREGRPVRLVRDRDGDGRAEETLLFDDEGRPLELREDRNGDGRPDRWRFYREGRLVRLAEDRNGDGRADLEAELAPDGTPVRVRRDGDGDGCFEVQEERHGTERVVTTYRLAKEGDCSSARVFSRSVFEGDRPRRRLFDQDLDGEFELEEVLGADGRRCLLLRREGEKAVEAFLYRGDEEPRFGYRDRDGDGLFEEVFDYRAGRWEDTAPVSQSELEGRCAGGDR